MQQLSNFHPLCNNNGVIQIIGNDQLENISLDLQLINIDLYESRLRIEFSKFRNVHFYSLNITNNIYDRLSNEDSFITIINCSNIIIDYIFIKQDYEHLFGLNMINFLNSNLTINKGYIEYCQQFKKDLIQTFILTTKNDKENDLVILNNFDINIVQIDKNTNSKIFLNVQNSKIVKLNTFKINLQIINKQQQNESTSNLYILLYLIDQGQWSEINNFTFNYCSQQQIYLQGDQLQNFIIQKTQLNITNFTMSLQRIVFSVISITDSAKIFINNFNLINSNIIQQKNEYNSVAEKPTVVFISNSDIVEINNLFITNVQIKNFQFFIIKNAQNLIMTNITFSKNMIQNESSTLLQNKKIYNQDEYIFSWENNIFIIVGGNNFTFDQLNVFDMSFLGTALLDITSDCEKKISNVNFYIDKQLDGFQQGNFIDITGCSKTNFTKINITIDASINNISLGASNFINQWHTNDCYLVIDQYYVDIVNLKDNPNFVINSAKGSFLNVHNSEDKKTKILLNNITAYNVRNTGVGGFGYLESTEIIIQNCYFQDISSEVIGGTFILKSKILQINNTIFYRCHSGYLGGALYIWEKLSIAQFLNVEVNSCYSFIGGGIVGPLSQKDQKEIKYLNNSSILLDKDHSKDIDSVKVVNIQLYNPQFQDKQLNLRNMTHYYFQFDSLVQVFLSQAQPQQTYIIELELIIENVSINIPQNLYNSSFLSLTNYLRLYTDSNTNLDLYKQIDDVQNFYFMIKFPYFEDISTTMYFLNQAKIQIQLHKNTSCSDGQVKKDGLCQFCEDNSVTERENNQTQIQCLKCDDFQKFKDCYAYKSILNEGYISRFIQYCSYFPKNCIGGEFYGNENCLPPHIGPECLECDFLYKIDNSFNCQECSDYTNNKIFFILQLFFSLLAIWILYFIIIQANQTRIVCADHSNQQHCSQQNKREQDERQQEKNESIVYLKLLVFYLNIIYVCSFYQIKNQLLGSVFNFQINLYNPFIGSYFSYFKCYLIQEMISQYRPSQIQIIILSLSPFILITSFIICKFLYHSISYSIYWICQGIQSRQNQNQIINEQEQNLQLNTNIQQNQFQLRCFDLQNYKHIPVLFLFFLNYLNIQSLEYLIYGCFCHYFEQYGNVSISDLNLFCDNQEFLTFRNYIYIPLIILYIFIPLFILFFLIYQNIKNRSYHKILSFLYQEYNDVAFYWDFARNFIRIMIIMIIYLIIPSNNIIGYPIIFILGIYVGLLIGLQPYNNKNIMKTEIILVGSGIYLIFCCILNYAVSQNDQSPSLFYQIIFLIGNLVSLMILLYLTFKIFKNILIKLKSYL